MENRKLLWIIGIPVTLAIAGVLVLGMLKRPAEKKDIVIPDDYKSPIESMTTPEPTETVTEQPTPTPTPTPVVLREYEKVTLEVDNIELYDVPKNGTFHYTAAYYLRKEPGRTAERLVKIPKDTEVLVNSRCTNMFNEPWYGITVTVDEKEYTGFVQWSTVSLDGVEAFSDPEANGLLNPAEPIENPTGTLGADNDGDGIYHVVLDPGHGGRDSGAYYYNTNEKDIDFKVATYCKAYLEEHYDNVVVDMTRTGDYIFDTFDSDDDLEYRVRVALEKNADVFVSMHFNTGQKKMKGSLALIPKKDDVYEKNLLLASYLTQELEAIGIPNEGIKWKKSSIMFHLDGTPMDGYLVLRLTAESGIPSCIIEHCYMDNPADRQYWNSEAKLQAIGESDARAIARFLGLPEQS